MILNLDKARGGLSFVVLCLLLASCGAPPVQVTQLASTPKSPPLSTATIESLLPSPTASENPSQSPTATLEDLASKIDNLMRGLTEREAFTGAVLVARGGEILFSQGYDLADRDKQLPNTPQTRFRLGSITKQFTAMAILILQAEGRLDVQEPICTYVPDCPAAWQGITIHHLLTHTSGIPNFTDHPEYRNIKATPSPPDQTIARIQDKPLNFQPGGQWRYSNSGYIVLGYIVEQVSGQSYETFLEEKIFEPLEMANTDYEHTDSNLAVGYTGFTPRWAKADFIDMSLPYAAGGLYSTVEDLYRWDQALYTEQLVSRELMGLMFTPHAEMDNKWSYGYGWVLGEMNGRPVVGHDGGIDGFVSAIMRYPEDKTVIIVLSNRETTFVHDITEQIANLIFAE